MPTDTSERAAPLTPHGCSITLRRFEGPAATELWLHCRPPAAAATAGDQAEAMYRAIADVLDDAGGSLLNIASQTLFLRDLPAQLDLVRQARKRVCVAASAGAHRPATTEIEQPPLDDAAEVEVSVHAVLPRASSLRFESIEINSACPCPECTRVHGVQYCVGDDRRLLAGGLCGAGDTAFEQTQAVFALAEALLKAAGMTFHDVVRTWIYLRDIGRDYHSFNRARRQFFDAHGIEPVPASTGIGAGPVSADHVLALGFYAVRAGAPVARTVMTSPTLNEAAQYGADFVRGMRVEEDNKTALFVSGTASIDEHGRTAHVGDVAAQADRMLLNVETLLREQGAGFADVVAAMTYLKHPADKALLLDKFRAAGFDGFPNALVVAPVCRSDLLCETELLAVLPGGAIRSRP